MASARTVPLDLRTLLKAVEDAPPIAAAGVVGEHLGGALGATEVAFLIADFSGQALIRLGDGPVRRADGRPGHADEDVETVSLIGTPHGRVLLHQSIEVVVETVTGPGVLVLAPVSNRGEAIGVLELTLPAPPSPQALADVAVAAHLLAYVVIANRRFTDLFEWGQRTVPLSLAAEIQHRLLPGAYTCEAGQFTLAAWLEPAGNIGGDTFDFALERDALSLSMTDAMGHTVEAAVLATVLVGALRNARRAGLDLAAQVARANAGLTDFIQANEFVTGQVARVDLTTGTATIVNAGHPPPLRLRDGRVESVTLASEIPFGIDRAHAFRAQPLDLRPGDRLMFLTDGLLEREASRVDAAALMLDAAELHPREAVQHLIRAVLEATGGTLKDDATAMCLDWHGGDLRDRDSNGGANPAGA